MRPCRCAAHDLHGERVGVGRRRCAPRSRPSRPDRATPSVGYTTCAVDVGSSRCSAGPSWSGQNHDQVAGLGLGSIAVGDSPAWVRSVDHVVQAADEAEHDQHEHDDGARRHREAGAGRRRPRARNKGKITARSAWRSRARHVARRCRDGDVRPTTRGLGRTWRHGPQVELDAAIVDRRAAEQAEQEQHEQTAAEQHGLRRRRRRRCPAACASTQVGRSHRPTPTACRCGPTGRASTAATARGTRRRPRRRRRHASAGARSAVATPATTSTSDGRRRRAATSPSSG